jgi:cysteine sulfinate desulfinase/cysteine desulfurase-like protein
MSFVIYLDHNATTTLSEVLEPMRPYLTTEWGNPSSSYKFGPMLKSVVEAAREHMAELIGAPSRDVVFASCARESNNATIAAALKADPTKRHIVTSQAEHSSAVNYCMAPSNRRSILPSDLHSGGLTPPFGAGEITTPRGGLNLPLRESSCRVTYLGVDCEGLLKLADLEAGITDQTAADELEEAILSWVPNTNLNGPKRQ